MTRPTTGWRRPINGLSEAIGFLTPVPSGARLPSAEALLALPLAGALIGLFEGAAWKAFARRWPAPVAAALTTAAHVVLTGALHLDGLADSTDGLLAHAPSIDRLEIMAQPAIGSFGVTALTMAISLRTSALSALQPSPSTLAASACGARSVMVLATCTMGYARGSGLVSPFLGGHPHVRLLCGTAGLAAATALARRTGGARACGTVVAGTVAGASVLALARRRLGGYTGDVLGAAGVLFETAMLVALARQAPPARQQR